MTPEERSQLIDQLDRAFTMMPKWVKAITKHAMGAPKVNSGTGQPFRSFREAIEAASDETLVILRYDFDSNDYLLPAQGPVDVPVGRESTKLMGYEQMTSHQLLMALVPDFDCRLKTAQQALRMRILELAIFSEEGFRPLHYLRGCL